MTKEQKRANQKDGRIGKLRGIRGGREGQKNIKRIQLLSVRFSNTFELILLLDGIAVG